LRAGVADGVGAVFAGEAGVREGGAEAGGVVEVWQGEVGRAHAGGVVGVRAHGGGDAELGGDRRRLVVVRLVLDLGVEDLDDVYAALGAQRGQDPADAGPDRVERVRHVHEAALVPDPGDDFGQRQHVRDPLGQVQADDVAGRRPD